MKTFNILRLIPILIFSALTSCKKSVEVAAPINSIASSVTFASDVTATAAIAGIYSRMMATGGFASGGASSVTLFSALSGDELINFPQTNSSPSVYFYANTLLPTNAQPGSMWTEVYQYIFTANSIIENLAGNSAITPALNQQLTGEAKFIRAFCYFYLTNLFGDVPLTTTTNYLTNAKLSRASQADVYKQIVTDLKDAQGLLVADYSTSTTGERIRPNKWAATALLARTYLYMGQWTDAEAQSTTVITNSQYAAPLPDLPAVYLKNSKETIWALKPLALPLTTNTPDAATFIIGALGPNGAVNSVPLSDQMLSSFESGDKRKTAWVGSVTVTNANPALTKTWYYAYKYKVNSSNAPLQEYSIVLRVGEQYLIRSEAKAQQANFTGAAADLNIIRTRAGLPNTTATDLPSFRTAILNERRTELFTEWGHRWLDLKRTKTVDDVMKIVTPIKGGTWNTNWQLYPIPQTERLSNPQLSQNNGYN